MRTRGPAQADIARIGSSLIDPHRLAAFALMTMATSLVPGPSMLFVMGQSVWRGKRSGFLALAGLQTGNAIWFLLAGLGLGSLAEVYPQAFRVLTFAAIAYLGWVGLQILRHSGLSLRTSADQTKPGKVSRRAFGGGIATSLSNPKSLVYIAALLPPFVNQDRTINLQLATLAVVAISIDSVVGLLYIVAGAKLSDALARPKAWKFLEMGTGVLFLAIAMVICIGSIAA